MKNKPMVVVGTLLLVLVLGAGTAAQTCVQRPSGLVSWWPGDGNATDVVDGNHGTLLNGASFASGQVGQAFDFSAVGHEVRIPNDPSLDLESLPVATFEGWFRSFGGLDQGGGSVVIAKHVCGTNTGWFFTTIQGGFIGSHWVGGFGVGALNLNDGQFHHFAIVKDGTNYFEYIDGNLISSDTGPASGTSANAPVQIGSIDTGTCFSAKHQLNGLVDEIGIYHRALSAAEIQAIFDAGSAGKCKEIPVTIDIKPGSFPNSINLNSAGVIPVAILSSDTFDASTEADPDSLALAGAAVRVVGKSHKSLCHSEDVNGDGFLDLVCQFENELDVQVGDSIAVLEGETFAGTPIRGEDSINIVP